jgi:hypothetical protein
MACKVHRLFTSLRREGFAVRHHAVWKWKPSAWAAGIESSMSEVYEFECFREGAAATPVSEKIFDN